MYLKKPDIVYLRVIGSKSWVLIPKISRGGKFRSRSVVYRLLGMKDQISIFFGNQGVISSSTRET